METNSNYEYPFSSYFYLFDKSLKGVCKELAGALKLAVLEIRGVKTKSSVASDNILYFEKSKETIHFPQSLNERIQNIVSCNEGILSEDYPYQEEIEAVLKELNAKTADLNQKQANGRAVSGSLISDDDTLIIFSVYIKNMKRFCSIIDGTSAKDLGFVYILVKHIIEEIRDTYLKDIQRSSVTYELNRDVNIIMEDAVTEFLSCNRLPDKHLISFLSSLTYESSNSFCKIAFCKSLDDIPSKNTLVFRNNVKIEFSNSRTIRKLMEMGRSGYVLLACGAAFNIKALIPEQELEDKELLVIEFEGHMRWGLRCKSHRIMCYEAGRHRVATTQTENLYCLKKVDGYLRGIGDFSEDRAAKIKWVIEQAGLQKHGTLLIFAKNAEKQAERLCSRNRGIRVNSLCLYNQEKLMKCVTSIDGAVLLDLECTCYGVGVILDGEAKSKGNLSRGARYNSALTFLDGKKGYMAVVVSEDRTIDIIVKDQNPAKKAELPQTDC